MSATPSRPNLISRRKKPRLPDHETAGAARPVTGLIVMPSPAEPSPPRSDRHGAVDRQSVTSRDGGNRSSRRSSGGDKPLRSNRCRRNPGPGSGLEAGRA